MLRISLDSQIEELEQNFETAHLNYLQQTAIRTHEFKELTEKDQILGLDIEEKIKKIDNLQVHFVYFTFFFFYFLIGFIIFIRY
jgi:hypothetical protein